MSPSFLQYFPYTEYREIQRRVLLELEKNWEDYDVFVISAPTAFGKTALSQTLINASPSTSVITPTNMLVSQYREEFPQVCTLSRLDSYTCTEWNRPCSVTRGKTGGFCKGCPASKDLARAKYRRGPGVYNYHIYSAHKIFRDTLVVDEAHNLIPVIRERHAIRLWQHDYNYPDNMYTIPQAQQFIEGLPAKKRATKKIQVLEEAVFSRKPGYVFQRSTDWFNGAGTKRGEPEERDCIKLLPVDIRGVPPMFWPRDVRKIVLLSATINHKDIQTLGLNTRKVLYIECESPIPPDCRPIVTQDLISVNRFNIVEASEMMATYIRETLAPSHPGQKGVIHATYQMAAQLYKHLGPNGRYIFHTKHNKAEQYQAFRESTPEEGKVLVACGMYEGMDLPEDLGRWQVIAKVPWPSLGNPAIRYLADRDPDWYSWEIWRIVMQACGRICRTPTDFGVTYILDSSFWRLYNKASHLIPEWYRDGLRAGGSID